MGLGPTEVSQYPVAQIFGHVSVEARDATRDRVLVAAHHLLQVLRVERLRQLGRAHEINEHHRELTALRMGSRGLFVGIWLRSRVAGNRLNRA